VGVPARPLLSWLEQPGWDRGVRFARAADGWEFWPYERLADRVARAACTLADSGVAPDDVVAVVARPGPSFVAAFFGAMVAGAAPLPVAPLLVFDDPSAYAAHLAGLLRAGRPAAVVADPDLAGLVGEVARAAGVPRLVTTDALAARAADRAFPLDRPADAVALLQFTSGSTGSPRGVAVPYAALEANTGAVRRWLRAGPGDAWASWLPVHHDMGLVGCLVTPVVGGHDAWLLDPAEFVHRPLRWLECFGRHGATITATPSFGLDYVVRRVGPHALAGLDFSGWKAIVVGAERIEPGTLERFAALLGPHGLRRGALLPAYGLAEATLAVTGVPVGEDVDCVRVRPGSLAVGRSVEPADDPDAVAVVGCGRPLDGLSVNVAGDDGRPLPDGTVGEIVVRGSSVASRYLGPGGSASLSRLDGDVLRTGDAGFLADGRLYVLGRLGDALKVRGRAVFAEDLELALVAAGPPAARVAVLLGSDAGEPAAVALLEEAAPESVAAARSVLERHAQGARVVVLAVPKGTIARTSSGKPRRRWLWRAYAERRLPGQEHRTAPEPAPALQQPTRVD
jgi:acyl-CoA synthetase (AMP-forming)/AMP-acid ligase II